MGPPLAALDWAAQAVGHGAHVVHVRRLVGGTSSVVHALSIASANGMRHELVMRRRVGQDVGWASPRIEQEVGILQALSHTRIPAPDAVAWDPAGGVSGGTPAILMTRLPGHIHLAPSHPDYWVRELARCLATIHSVSLDLPAFAPRFLSEPLAVPTWTSRPGLWSDAISLVRGPHPTFARHVVHTDFQHFNVLWQRERITGVVDWAGAVGDGPAEVDVAHCCLNLAVLWNADWAERFRSVYEDEVGHALNAWWEVATLMRYLPGWNGFIQIQAGRRAVIDLAGMHGRVEELLANTLQRVE